MSIEHLTEPVPDLSEAEFKAEMDQLASMDQQLWHLAHKHPKPDIPDTDLLCDFIPGCEVELFLAVDMAAFDLIGDDIAKWVAA